jgi:hypothetical protein
MLHDDHDSRLFNQRQSFGSWEPPGPLRQYEPWNPLRNSHMRWPVSSGDQEGSAKDTIHTPRAPPTPPDTNVSLSPWNILNAPRDCTDSYAEMRAPCLPAHGYSNHFSSSFPVSYSSSMSAVSSPSSSDFLSRYRQSEYGGSRSYVLDSTSVDATSSCPSIYSETSSSCPETMYCQHKGCTVGFTGKHRRGTLHRHMRLKHGGALEHGRLYACQAQGCGKDYKRQDALLKHQRHKHPELGIPPPTSRKQELEP